MSQSSSLGAKKKNWPCRVKQETVDRSVKNWLISRWLRYQSEICQKGFTCYMLALS